MSDDTIHYLDDTLCVNGSQQECRESLEIFITTATQAGFTIKEDKTIGPVRMIEFLGITIDTVLKELRISEQRMAEIQKEIKGVMNKKHVTKREMLSLR